MRIRFSLAVFGLCLMLYSLCGCETVKGAAKGGAEGLSKDIEEAKKADKWMQENLW